MSLSLREIILEIAREVIERDFGLPCKVVKDSYDEATQSITCEPINGKADFVTVKLQAEIGSGVLIIPEDDSVVIVEQTSGDTAYISMFGKVKEIVYLGGENKGVVKVTENVEKLNKIEQDLNELKNVFSSWTPAPNDGGAVLKGLSGPWSAQPLTETQIEELENENFKH